MGNVGRQYNALTGAELKIVIVKEVDRALDQAGINSMGVTYPLASWSWTLTLKQIDPQTGQTADTPERQIGVEQTEAEAWEASNHDAEIKKARLEAASNPPLEPVPSDNPENLSMEELDALTKPAESSTEKITRALRGGSKRFRHNPPAPTDVRETEQLPMPEA